MILKTPIPRATKSCLNEPNKLLLKRPLFGWFALGLASLATGQRGLFIYPMKERRQEMNKLTPGEQAYRDEMFRQGLLWCSGHKQFELIKHFRKYGRADRSNYGYRYYCDDCARLQHKDRSDRHNEYFKKRNNELKKKWVELAGGCCQRCGYSEFNSAIDFHHVYSATKKHNPSPLIFKNNSKKTWEELDKCCLLCSICHRAYKAREWQAEFIKRDGLGWTVGDALPLDDDRYETKTPPKYQQATMPLFHQQRDLQLRLFEQSPHYVT